MKLIAFLMLAACLQLSAAGFSQTITLSEKNAPLEKVFTEIKKQTGYDFFYETKLLRQAGTVDIHVTNAGLEEVLTIVFKDKPITYTIVEKTILVKAKPLPALPPPANAAPPPIVIKGRVVDDKSGEPVSDASVMVKGSRVGVNTNREGEFSLSYDGVETITLVVSHIGYAEKQVSWKGADYITVRLMVSDQSLANVEVSTGIFRRNKESFTGATATFSGDQLKTIGNNNIIQSLKTLDPSFIVVENNKIGSNPNALPTIELRGKTSINLSTTDVNNQFASDPNQPLFILNGFPTTLEIINNLDMNRVASVTILKDAASTAMWGSKAANGVVVVETKRPVAGELRLSYTADLRFDAPDLSSYNMMNSAEALEFERLAGVFTEGPFYVYKYDADQAYNKLLAQVRRGVNTYWLAEPVRNGFTNGHSLQMTGGNNDLLFGAGVTYRDQQGVMKGSGKKIWGSNIDITYRKGKINITDQLYLSGYQSNESPYGSFSDFVQANPLYIKRNADGTVPRYLAVDSTLGNGAVYQAANPLYNASLFSINHTDNLDINNSLQAVLNIRPYLWLQGGFQVTRGAATSTLFVSPENTGFDGAPQTEKGAYTNTQYKTSSYTGNLTLTFARVFNHTHSITANIRSEIKQASSWVTGFRAVGYPEGTNGNPAFATKYDPYSVPLASTSVVRSVNTTGSFNYAFKLKYLLDAVYTINGSNAFGSDHKISPSWSVGLGWNLGKEGLFRQYKWLDMLKLRADVGVSGNENLGTFSSNSVYTALAGSNMFGSSVVLTGLGDPGLQWQSTRMLSTGVEIAALDNRISAVLNYYDKRTDPLIVSASGILPSSVGLTFPYPENVGALDYKGWELNLRVSPIYKIRERIVWTIGLMAGKATGRYSGLGNALDVANKEQLDQNGFLRYKDGYSPDDIWAVVSKGIDPATGQELFLKKDGTLTFIYSADDITKIANSRPTWEGVISSALNYKGLSLNVAFRYQTGGYALNTALYDKVENIGGSQLRNNQDRRALYDRWQQPGDIAQFKSIKDASYTPISSRFIQKNNYLAAESISIGWDFIGSAWIHKIGMQGFRILADTNDLFRWSTIQTERGIDYPFARSFSLGINASF